MPNWCDNWVKLSHDDPAMLYRASNALLCGRFLKEFLPIPPELHATDSMYPPSAAQLANKARCGYESWYDWCAVNWGTVKELFSPVIKTSDDGKSLELRFDSAWSPPRAAFETLEKQYGFRLKAYFIEPCMHICGMRENGVTRDFDISSVESSEQIKAIIPPEMDAHLGVSTSGFFDFEDN